MAQPRSLALLASLVSLTTLALACASKFQIDPDGYCDDTGNANEVNCPGGGGGSNGGKNGGGGSAGVMGMGGGGGGTMGDGGAGAGGGDITCEEGKSPCGDVCVDLNADPDNCGECVHSCSGALCTGGSCEAQIVANNQVAPYALAQNKVNIFWTSPARIFDGSLTPRVHAVPKGGVGPTDLFPGTLVRSASLAAASDGLLYWGSLGTNPGDTGAQRIARGAPGNSDGSPIIQSQFNVQSVALNANNRIYWTVENDAAVRGGPVDGSGGSGGFDVEISIQGKVGWVAVDADEQPYWIRKDGGEVRRRNMSAPASTNQFELVAKSTNPISVELGNSRVYWADRTEGIVRSAPTNKPSEFKVEFEGKGPIEGFALENAVLYVVTLVDGPDSSKVLQVWRKNSRPDPLRLGQVTVRDPATYASGNPFGAAFVLFDTGYVYFADVGKLSGQSAGVPLSDNDGVIYRVAK